MEKRKIVIISDCDGVLTNGQFTYTIEGKVSKIYGPHDNDGVKILKNDGYEIVFITADKRGFDITQKRITDMNCDLYLVSESERLKWIKSYIKNHDYEGYIYIADGISDVQSLSNALLSIVPKNGRKEAKRYANYITESNAGEGAFLDAALFIMDNIDFIYRFKKGYDISNCKIKFPDTWKILKEDTKAIYYENNIKQYVNDFVYLNNYGYKRAPTTDEHFIKNLMEDNINIITKNVNMEDNSKWTQTISGTNLLHANCFWDDMFKENLKENLNKSINSNSSKLIQKEISNIKKNTMKYDDLLNIVLDYNYEILSTVSTNEIENFISLIIKYKDKHIIGIGAGRMGYSLRGFIMRLMHLGFNASFYGDTNVPYPDKDTLVIFNSSSGETKTLVLFANIINNLGKENHPYICTVTSDASSTLARNSDLVITLPRINDEFQPMKTLNEQSSMLFFDIIARMLMDEMNIHNNDMINNHSILE